MHPSSKEHITFTSPKALLAERMPANASALWFTAPTVQRLLRSVGAEETFLTGNGADFEKFSVLLSSLPALRGSALAEAVAAELTAFGAPSITADAAALWQLLSTQPAEEDAPPLSRSAADTLLPFSPEKLSEFANYPQNGVEKLSVRPILHPDPLLMANRRGFAARMKEFGQSVGVEIRDLASLTRALEHLQAAAQAMNGGVTPDAVLTEAEGAMAALGELTGRSIRQDVTQRIFARFCVGK
jgi:tRNA modification GTPase